MEKRILIAAPVFQKEEIFKEYLNSLNHLIIPEGYTIKKFFYLHNSPQLTKFLKEDEYKLVTDDTELLRNDDSSKIWTKENYKALYKMRTALLRKAAIEKYDYLFTVDSDILLHPKTLIKLIQDNKKVIGNMLWTRMDDKRLGAICGEQENWKSYDNVEIFKKPGIYPIGWTCACLLISSYIFNNPKISYFPILGVDNTGCEDYAFSLRIRCNFPDVQMYIDTTYPSRHLYRQKDYERWMKEKKQYE